MSAWLLYAMLAPLIFSVNNVMEKFIRTRHLSTFTFAIFSGLGYFSILVLLPFVDLPSSPTVIILSFITGSLFFLNSFPYFQALSIEEASRVVPLWALEAPVALVLSFIFLGERLQPIDYAGFVLVVSGAFLISARNLRDVLIPGRVFMLMLLATLITAVGLTMSKWVYAQVPFWSAQVLFWSGGGLTALIIMALFRAKAGRFFAEVRQLSRGTFLQLGIRQFLLLSAFLVFGMAIMTGSVSLSAALVQLTALYVFLIATTMSLFKPHLIKENIGRKALLMKAAAILMIVAGVFAINV